MSARLSSHWADVDESTFAAGIWFFYGLHRLVGRRVLLALMRPVVWCWGMARPGARRASLEYLARMQAVHGVPAGALGAVHWQRHLMAFAETILDKLLAYSGRYPFDQVRFEGRQHLDALAAQDRGALLLTAHIGCLEVCQALAARVPGLKLTVLVHTHHAQRFNRLLERLNPGNPVRLMQVTDVDAATAVLLRERIEAGEFVALVGDRVPVRASKITRVPFLGQAASLPVGAYVLAALIGCPLLLIACIREPRGHAVCIEPLADRVTLPRGSRDAALAALAARFAAWLETRLVRAPYEWFNFFPFWSQGGAGAKPLTGP